MLAKFPETIEEFLARFSSHAQCADYLLELRWPDGFRCPSCQGAKAWRTGWRRLECAACGKETSLTAGTVLHKTRVPLRVWFWAIFLFARSKQGLSANELARQAGLRQETAWLLLHKLRNCLEERRPLDGKVEADEALVGGVDKGRPGRSHGSKAIVALAVEDRGESAGRARLEVVPSGAAPILNRFVSGAVVKAVTTEIRTDGWKGYGLLERSGYRHVELVAKVPSDASRLLPWVHRVISNLKAWIWGTFRGVSKRYLPCYLREFAYRFNRRADEPSIFARILKRIVINAPVTLDQLQAASRG